MPPRRKSKKQRVPNLSSTAVIIEARKSAKRNRRVPNPLEKAFENMKEETHIELFSNSGEDLDIIETGRWLSDIFLLVFCF
jgi:hypothetical protein